VEQRQIIDELRAKKQCPDQPRISLLVRLSPH